MYHVRYEETEHTALIDLPAIHRLPTTEATLDDVADNCELYHCAALVSDAAVACGRDLEVR
jgi:hypothetical protein